MGSPLHGKSDGIDLPSASAILFNLWWIIEHSDCTIHCRKAEYNRLSQTRFRSPFHVITMNSRRRVMALVSFLFHMLLSCRRSGGMDLPAAEMLSTNCHWTAGLEVLANGASIATKGLQLFPGTLNCGHLQVVFAGPKYSEEHHHPQRSAFYTLELQGAQPTPAWATM